MRRRQVGLGAIGVLLGLALTAMSRGPAVAQSTSAGVPIAVTASSAGVSPAGVSGIRVSFLCRDLATAVAETVRSIDVPLGGSGSVPLEAVSPSPTSTPPVTGTSCQITAALRGTSGTSSGLVSISVDGIDRTGAQGIDSNGASTAVSSVLNGATSSPYVRVGPSTVIAVIVRYPLFVVRKAVVGTEAVPGAEYPIAIECFSVPVLPYLALTTLAGGYRPGDLVVPDRGWVTLQIAGVARRVWDATASGVTAPDVLGTASGLSAVFPPSAAQSSTERVGQAIYTALSLPVRAGSGTFTLRRGTSRAISTNDVPDLTPLSSCRFVELDDLGASSIVSSVGGEFVPRGASTAFATNLAPYGSTVTITNIFTGTLAVRVAASGDDGQHIRTFRVRVVCEALGIDDTFLLKSGQSMIYDRLVAGTTCAVTEPRTDGAALQIVDTTGPVASDGVVVIPAARGGCGPGSAVLASGPSGNVPGDVCLATVLLSNRFGALAP